MSESHELTLSSEQIYDGRLLRVHRDEVALPDGSRSIREWIDHPGAAAVVTLFEDGSTLLVRQFRYATRTVYLEVPAGKRDGGEPPEETARRELSEETGLTAATLTPLGALDPAIGYSNEVIHFFLAEHLTEGASSPAEGEHVEPVRLPFSEAVEMARRGAMPDMKTVVAFSLADAFLSARAKKV